MSVIVLLLISGNTIKPTSIIGMRITITNIIYITAMQLPYTALMLKTMLVLFFQVVH